MTKKDPDSGWNPHDHNPKTKVTGRWWQQKEGEVHKAVFPLVRKLRQNQEMHYIGLNRFTRLYEHGDASVYHESVKSEKIRGFMSKRLSFNLLKSCVDTASSKIAKVKPRPVYMGAKGFNSHENNQRAKAMTKFMEGQFQTIGHGVGDERSLYGIGRRVFVDAAVQGPGAAHFYGDFDSGQVCCDRVNMNELVWDEFEAMFGPPKSLHRHVQLPRDTVLAMYGNVSTKVLRCIETAQRSGGDTGSNDRTDHVDFIDLIESWHLKSGASSKDGFHSICIENCDITADPDWKKDRFPILLFRWTPRLVGWGGIGLGQELFGIQFEMNKLLYNIQLAQHLMAAPQVWLEVQSATVPQHLNNQFGAQRYYKGARPYFLVPTAMSAEVYNHLENLYRKGFEITGISLMAATSQKPGGLNSGRALREYKDIQTERFALTEQRYEEWFMDAAALIEDICDDLSEAGKEPTAMVRTGQYLDRIRWKEIKLPTDKRIVRPHPSNILPSEPSGKLATVQEMVQAGFFDKDEALDLLDYPDLSTVKRLKTSGRTILMKVIEEMLDTGVYIPPEPFMDLVKARPLAQAYYLEAKINNAPEELLELLRRFMEDVRALIEGETERAQMAQQQLALEAAAAQGQQPGATAVAQPQPTSDLIPQV